jgi:hypothetical protein
MNHVKLAKFRDKFAGLKARVFDIRTVHHEDECGSTRCVQGWAEAWGFSETIMTRHASYAVRFAEAFEITKAQAEYITEPNAYRPKGTHKSPKLSTALRHINDVLYGRK